MMSGGAGSEALFLSSRGEERKVRREEDEEGRLMIVTKVLRDREMKRDET